MAKKTNLCPTEFDEQAAVIAWARMMVETNQEPRLELLHGDSSGVRVPIGCAVKMRRAGAVKGWPDLFMPVGKDYAQNGEYPKGLFIELKRRKGGVLSPEQLRIHHLLRQQGYRVETCRGSDEAIELLQLYLGI